MRRPFRTAPRHSYYWTTLGFASVLSLCVGLPAPAETALCFGSTPCALVGEKAASILNSSCARIDRVFLSFFVATIRTIYDEISWPCHSFQHLGLVASVLGPPGNARSSFGKALFV